MCFANVGEIGCLLNRTRQNTIIAATLAELYSLERKRVLEIMAEFPEWADEVRKKALLRVENHNLDKSNMSKGVLKAARASVKREKELDEMDAAIEAAKSVNSAMQTRSNSMDVNATASEKLAQANSVDLESTEDRVMQQIGESKLEMQKQMDRMEEMQRETAEQVTQIMKILSALPATSLVESATMPQMHVTIPLET